MSEPLVPAEVDLRDFPFMPLDVVRLRDSDIAAIPDAEAFRGAVLSWCASWHQVPAASLPDDDAMLARLLGYGRDVKGWQKLRVAGALKGWVKCSDGRLYHPVVAEKATDAWTKKCAQRNRTEAARRALELRRLQQLQQTSVTDIVADSKGQGQGQGQGQGELLTPPQPPSADAEPPPTNGHDLLGEKPPKPKRSVKSPYADGWTPKPTTLDWVNAFLAEHDLSEHWAQQQHDLFIGKAKANGWAYADWDQAYQNFFRENGPGGRYHRPEPRA